MENKEIKNNFEQFKKEIKVFFKKAKNESKEFFKENFDDKNDYKDNEKNMNNKNCCEPNKYGFDLGKVIIGIIIISLGTLLLLSNLNILEVDFKTLANSLKPIFWPAIIILSGLSILTRKHVLSSILRIFFIIILMFIILQIIFNYQDIKITQIDNNTFRIEDNGDSIKNNNYDQMPDYNYYYNTTPDF